MPWWGYGIIAGVIFICVTLILIWIIIASNKIVILRRKVDRYFPLMNAKLKEYIKAIDDLLVFCKRKEKKESRPCKNLKIEYEKLKSAEGIFAKVEKVYEVESKVESIGKYLKKTEIFKGSKKAEENLNLVLKNQNEIYNLVQKYNMAAKEYNTVIKHSPTYIIAERFKFYEVNYFKEKGQL